MKLKHYRVYCQGKGPGLFMDCMSEETLEAIRTKSKQPAAPSSPPTRQQEAVRKLYRDPADPDGCGPIGIPATMLFACLRHGGRFVKYPKLAPKATVSTAAGTHLPVVVTLEEDFIPLYLEDEDGREIETDWEKAWYADMRKGNNNSGMNSVAVAVVRPCFRRWGFQVHIEVDVHELHPDSIKQIFVEAGRRAGLGGNRPNTGGPFGQFSVLKFEPLDAEEVDEDEQPANISGEARVGVYKRRPATTSRVSPNGRTSKRQTSELVTA